MAVEPLDDDRQRRDQDDRRERRPGRLALPVAEPQDQQGDDHRAAAHSEQPAEGPRGAADHRQTEEPPGHEAGHTKRVPAQTREGLAHALRPLTDAPERAAILCDIDGTLAPIAPRADSARVPPEASRTLAALARSYGLVACISGRSALDARRLVGVGGIAYVGAHGAELLQPSGVRPTVAAAYEEYTDPVREFASAAQRRLRGLGVRHEDKGPISALHWRGVPDEDAARSALEEVAREAEAAGLAVHWGRKVLEIRPPVRISKGDAVTALLEGRLTIRTEVAKGPDVSRTHPSASADLRGGCRQRGWRGGGIASRTGSSLDPVILRAVAGSTAAVPPHASWTPLLAAAAHDRRDILAGVDPATARRMTGQRIDVPGSVPHQVWTEALPRTSAMNLFQARLPRHAMTHRPPSRASVLHG